MKKKRVIWKDPNFGILHGTQQKVGVAIIKPSKKRHPWHKGFINLKQCVDATASASYIFTIQPIGYKKPFTFFNHICFYQETKNAQQYYFFLPYSHSHKYVWESENKRMKKKYFKMHIKKCKHINNSSLTISKVN